jgi:hypothetical protein
MQMFDTFAGIRETKLDLSCVKLVMRGKLQRREWADTQSSYPELGSLKNVEYFFSCPYCWERISVVLDTSVKRQMYVEDCEVCCQPIEVRYSVAEDTVTEFEAKVLE